MKIVETITKYLEYYINLVDKAAVGFERTDSNFERSSMWVKCYQTAPHATEKSFVNGRVSRCGKLHCFKKWPQLLQPSAATILIQSAATNMEASASTSNKITTHCRLR